MKDISIVSGEPFRAKILRYSRSELNKIVTAHLNMYKVRNTVFLAGDTKCQYNHKDNDLFAVVMKVDNIYGNRNLQPEDYRKYTGYKPMALTFVVSAQVLKVGSAQFEQNWPTDNI